MQNQSIEYIIHKVGDFSYCDYITETRAFELCVKRVADRLQNETLCYELKSNRTNQLCLGTILYDRENLTLETCSRIEINEESAWLHDSCLCNLAIQTNNRTYYDMVIKPSIFNRCENHFRRLENQ